MKCVKSTPNPLFSFTSKDVLQKTNIEILKLKKYQVDDLPSKHFFDTISINLSFNTIPYFCRENVDEKLNQCLSLGNNILISGKRYCGKSRLIYETLKKLDKNTIVFLPEIVNIEEEENLELLLPEQLSTLVKNYPQKKFILCLDNIKNLLGFNNLFSLIEELSQLINMTIIVAGRIENLMKFPDLLEIVPHYSVLNFCHIKIPELTNEDTKLFIACYENVYEEKIKLGEHYDRTIGSIIIDSSSFYSFYQKLAYNSYERKILWSLKCLNFLTGQNTFSRRQLLGFSIHQLESEHDVKLILDKEKVSFINAIDTLITESLIYVTNDAEFIFIPDYFLKLVLKGYLFDIVGSNNIKPRTKVEEEHTYTIINIFNSFIKMPYLMKNYILPLIFKQGGYDKRTRQTIYYAIRNKIELNIDLYNSFIEKCDKLLEVEMWENKVKQAKLQANLATLLAFKDHTKDFKSFKCKEDALNILEAYDSPMLCKAYFQKSKSIDDVEEIFKRFSRNTISSVHEFYFQNLINRLKNFNEGYRVYEMFQEHNIDMSPVFYKLLVQLDHGDFDLAFELYEKFQNINIELTDYPTILALAKKTTAVPQTEKVMLELKRLPETAIGDNIYSILLKKFKNLLNSKPWFRDKIATSSQNENNIQFLNQVLLIENLEDQERKDTLEKIISYGNLEVKSFELYLDYPSVHFLEAIKVYYQMTELNVYPSLNVFEIILEKFLYIEDNHEHFSEELSLLYDDIQSALEFESQENFKKLFLLLNQIYKSLDAKINIFELGIKLKFPVKKYISILLDIGNCFLDASKILDVIYAAEAIPEIDICFRLFKIFLPKGIGLKDREEVIIFFKDLKNCGVSDVILSRIYLSLINLNNSKISLKVLFNDLRNININFSREIIIETIFLELDQRFISVATLKMEFKNYFEDEVDSQLIEDIVYRCSNFQAAYSTVKAFNSKSIIISKETFKKILDFAIHERKSDDVIIQLLDDVIINDIDQLIPLISKLENRKQYESLLTTFITSQNIDLSKFKNPQNRYYWISIKNKAKERTQKEAFHHSNLVKQIKTAHQLEDALDICRYSLQNGVELEDLKLIKTLLNISTTNEINQILEFCITHNLDYLHLEVVSEFILHVKDETTSKSIFSELEKKIDKQRKNNVEYYQKIIYPFYCILSKVTQFEYIIEITHKILKIYNNLNIIILEPLALLTQNPKEVNQFVKLSQKLNIAIKEDMFDHLIEKQSLKKVWALLTTFEKEIKKYNSPIYNKLISINGTDAIKKWETFKELFSLNKNTNKYLIITKFMLSSNSVVNEEVFQFYSKSQISFNQFVKVLEIFEKEKIKFPFLIIEKKIDSLKTKNDKRKRIGKREKTRKYTSLLRVIRTKQLLSKVIPKLILEGKFNAVQLFSLIKREVNFRKKLDHLEIVVRYNNLGTNIIEEDSLLSIISSTTSVSDYWTLKGFFDEQKSKGKIVISTSVNSNMIERIISLRH